MFCYLCFHPNCSKEFFSQLQNLYFGTIQMKDNQFRVLSVSYPKGDIFRESLFDVLFLMYLLQIKYKYWKIKVIERVIGKFPELGKLRK